MPWAARSGFLEAPTRAMRVVLVRMARMVLSSSPSMAMALAFVMVREGGAGGLRGQGQLVPPSPAPYCPPQSAGTTMPTLAIAAKPPSFQELILRLHDFWSRQGCVILQPYDVEMGAGTFHPATTLRALGPKPWRAAYVQPSRRPTDGRY